MLTARWIYHPLHFRFEAGTSRGVLHQKDSWFLIISNLQGQNGIGELSLIPGLGHESANAIPQALNQLCKQINEPENQIDKLISKNPSLAFAYETARADLENGGRQLLFDTAFTRGTEGIPIHGLIWMGKSEEMKKQIAKKRTEGFNVIKLKVGAASFDEELRLIESIRNDSKGGQIELRLDANGAFNANDVMQKLKRLAEFNIHSIEQPVKAGDNELLKEVCQNSPIPVALDESLIGQYRIEEKEQLLSKLLPAFLVLKPSLTGGFKQAEEWIKQADKQGVDWWVSSALESNIGLNALAQWISIKSNKNVQALGTGQLFSNNISSPMGLENAKLYHYPEKKWQLNTLI